MFNLNYFDYVIDRSHKSKITFCRSAASSEFHSGVKCMPPGDGKCTKALICIETLLYIFFFMRTCLYVAFRISRKTFWKPWGRKVGMETKIQSPYNGPSPAPFSSPSLLSPQSVSFLLCLYQRRRYGSSLLLRLSTLFTLL